MALHCPFDPSTIYDALEPELLCPSCDCTVLPGAPHPYCVRVGCRYYDPVAASMLRHPAYRSVRAGTVFLPTEQKRHLRAVS